MREKILDLEENILVDEQIRDLLMVLDKNYFTKKDYSYSKIEDAYELCTGYKDMQVLVDTILNLCIENTNKIKENYYALINEEKGVKK